jgi:mannitol-1-/sugar-/sorbitol-6-/2-deoxyglucose-6-phosphatase
VIRAVIFDLDGLLIDSEPHWRAAEMEVFAEVGLRLSEDMCLRTTGLRVDEVVGYWFARAPWSGASAAEVTTRIIAATIARLREAGQAKPGGAEAIARVRRRGLPVGLASSSPMAIIRAAIERLGLADAFDTLHSAEDEALGKPHPAVYLTAAARLHVPATACLALEDSLNGLVAARAARMRCVLVPEHAPEDPRFQLADRVLPSLDAFTDEVWAAIERDMAG